MQLDMHSWVDGHFGCFCLLSIMDNATMDICVQVQVCQHMFTFLGEGGGHALLLKDLHIVIAVTMFSVFLRHVFKIIFKILLTFLMFYVEHTFLRNTTVSRNKVWERFLSGHTLQDDVMWGKAWARNQWMISIKYWIFISHNFLIWISFLNKL